MLDTDQTVYVGRRSDGSLYGVWTVRQWKGQEEVLADDQEVLAFSERLAPVDRRAKALEAMLTKAAEAPDAPQEVKEYVNTKGDETRVR